jgi:6-phosphogluconolactonase
MTRRHVTLGGLAFLASNAALSRPLRTRASGPERHLRATEPLWAYFGTYTKQESRGIYAARLDPVSGALSEPALAAALSNPSFLCVHPAHTHLFAVSEISDFKAERSGAVSAFAIDRTDGALRLLNQQHSGGAGPCHISIDNKGRNVLVANYGSGSVAVLPVAADGHLLPPASVVQHSGSSIHPRRQTAPHPHCIRLDKEDRYAFVADLGLDQIVAYRFDAAEAHLSVNHLMITAVAPGSGPRHFTLHPQRGFAYVINELTSTLTTFSYDQQSGELRELQAVSTLPNDFTGTNLTAEVQVHPTGNFLYGSNRGHDTIAAFSVDQVTGKLNIIGYYNTRGRTPRHFGIDPTGNFLLVANQNSDCIVVLHIDQQTGILEPAGSIAPVPSPVCVIFVEAT